MDEVVRDNRASCDENEKAAKSCNISQLSKRLEKAQRHNDNEAYDRLDRIEVGRHAGNIVEEGLKGRTSHNDVACHNADVLNDNKDIDNYGELAAHNCGDELAVRRCVGQI